MCALLHGCSLCPKPFVPMAAHRNCCTDAIVDHQRSASQLQLASELLRLEAVLLPARKSDGLAALWPRLSVSKAYRVPPSDLFPLTLLLGTTDNPPNHRLSISRVFHINNRTRYVHHHGRPPHTL